MAPKKAGPFYKREKIILLPRGGVLQDLFVVLPAAFREDERRPLQEGEPGFRIPVGQTGSGTGCFRDFEDEQLTVDAEARCRLG